MLFDGRLCHYFSRKEDGGGGCGDVMFRILAVISPGLDGLYIVKRIETERDREKEIVIEGEGGAVSFVYLFSYLSFFRLCIIVYCEFIRAPNLHTLCFLSHCIIA